MVFVFTYGAIILLMVPTIMAASAAPKKVKFLMPPTQIDPDSDENPRESKPFVSGTKKLNVKEYTVADYMLLVGELQSQIRKEYEAVDKKMAVLAEKVAEVENQYKGSFNAAEIKISAMGVGLIGILIGMIMTVFLHQIATKFGRKTHQKPVFPNEKFYPVADIQRKILLSES